MAAISGAGSNLVIHYTFDDGTAADASGNGNNGTINGATPIAGKIGSGAMQFDAAQNQYISSPTQAVPSDFSFSFWMKTTVGNYNNVIGWGTSKYFTVHFDGKICFAPTGTAYTAVCSTTSVADGTWHHIGLSNTGNAQVLYLDGRQVGTSAITPNPYGGQIDIGRSLSNSSYTGAIDDVYYYNRALLTSEIEALAGVTGGTVTPPPTTEPTPPPVVVQPPAVTTSGQIYIAQTEIGTKDGSSCANALGIAWFNTENNWGTTAGKIGPGVTAHLCGTINSSLSIFKNGTAGSPITIFFEPNAKVSIPVGTLIYADYRQYIVFDGGTNGIIENTDNGSFLGNKKAASGIYAPGAGNLEVKNLTIQNLYVHTSLADSSIDFGASAGIYLNGWNSNISIHDNTFKDICWVISGGGATGASNFNVYRNTFVNYDHGVASIGGSLASPANVNIYDNHFGSTVNWDTTANDYHHDGIHIYFGSGSLSGVKIYNNLFDGDWGINNTAHVFLEGNYNRTVTTASMSNFSIYNNTFIQKAGNMLNNGFLAGGGDNFSIYNNSFVGGGVRNSACLLSGGLNFIFKNNIVNGCTTFLNIGAGSTLGLVDYNLYSNLTEGGNYPWYLGTVSQTTFSGWQTATGQERNSALVTNATFDASGKLTSASPIANVGANPSGLITSTPSFLPGDFNKDGYVNSLDFSAMSGAWNTSNTLYDLNKDGTVNTLDYSIMVQNWTK